ncbi:MAG: phosphoglucosamine mutase [Frankiaceae bacterium]|nr:phosphoglucosamine mutase [Frankiaceae bacterium]
MPTLFGTDGVRGVAGVDLTADLARSIAAAAVAELAGDQPRPLVVVGRDPRPSGPWLEAAVIEGLITAGADVALLGVIPTPAVARAVADGVPGSAQPAAFGVVISASHNPAADNGIKLFGPGGVKLSDEAESNIEARLAAGALTEAERPGAIRVDLADQTDWYAEALVATLPSRLNGISVVVDCANGAAATVAQTAYARAGAAVTVINTDLSGEHINDGCGATHLAAIQAAVSAAGAEVGIAHDGDADRCLAVTATGDVVDGDAILAILAIGAAANRRLSGGAIAATVMSNLGLIRALKAHDIAVATTPVGDKSVADRMRSEGLSIGGEQSGHVVLLDHATTGDGILTGLHLLHAVTSSGRSLEELAAVVERLPQVLINVPVADRAKALKAVSALTAEVSAELGDDGRVLVRASGTEPLVRVMVEALTEDRARQLAERIADALR